MAGHVATSGSSLRQAASAQAAGAGGVNGHAKAHVHSVAMTAQQDRPELTHAHLQEAEHVHGDDLQMPQHLAPGQAEGLDLALVLDSDDDGTDT